jgi:thiamine-phosphate pyrophosphorylase
MTVISIPRQNLTKISRETLRIIDANLNRTGEGLRVLEEFARFSLNDEALTRRLKDLRHTLLTIPPGMQERLIAARDAAGDIGQDMKSPRQEEARDIAETIVANARRVQESLRVLEEIARTAALPLDTDAYKTARFSLYDIEKDLLARLLRRDKAGRLAGLYVIIDTAFLKDRDPAIVAGQALDGGASVIQLRAKGLDTRAFLAMAEKIKEVCYQRGAPFIVNDSLEVALAVDADGLHVGRDDLPVANARRLLPVNKLLGASVITVEDAVRARSEGADYLGVGCAYPTATKSSAGVVGCGRLAEIKQAVDLPIVAIGGINKVNIAEVMRTGAVAAAVISAVMGVNDVEGAARELVDIIAEVSRA